MENTNNILPYDGVSPETLFNEIRQLSNEIEACGKGLRELGIQAATAAADYEQAKNQTLIALFEDEAERNIKRTEAQRASIYRNAHKDLRLEKMLTANALKSEGELLKALMSKLSGLQTQRSIMQAEMEFSKQ